MFRTLKSVMTVLFILLFALAGCSSGSQPQAQAQPVATAPTTAPAQPTATTAPKPTVAPTAVPQPTKAPAWKEITRFEGESIKDTETFTVKGGEWRINWETSPGKFGVMNFQIYVYKADGNKIPVGIAANVIGAGKDSSVIRGKGDYYLTINTAQPYKIVIESKE